MQGTFTDVIQGSFEWTKTVLFKPFKLKKWIFLCIIALLAAEFSGCNLNLNLPAEKKEDIQIEERVGVTEKDSLPFDIKEHVWLIPFLIAIAIIGLCIMLLSLWLYSRFNFVFLNSIVKNDASIKGPFKENKISGNSFFKWNIIFLISIIFTFLLMILFLIGGIKIFQNTSLITKVLLIALWSLIVLGVSLFIVIIKLIVSDIVLPIMFKESVGIKKAWEEVSAILKTEKMNIAKYILIKIGLRIITGLMAGLFTMAVIFALLIPLGILGGALYGISLAIPEGIKLIYYVSLILIGIILFISIIFLTNIMLLPIPVFFRTYSLKFLARLDDRYNLFLYGHVTPKQG